MNAPHFLKSRPPEEAPDGSSLPANRGNHEPVPSRGNNELGPVKGNQEQSPPFRVLGIDPGLQRTGYAILEGEWLVEGGVLSSNTKLSLGERCREIGFGLREVLDQYRPSILAIEQVFTTGKNPKSSLLMAHARGTILFLAAERELPIRHFMPTQVKKTLTGNGRAPKDQVQRAITMLLGLDEILEPNDVADACAVALCGYYSMQQTRQTRLTSGT